MTSALDGLPIDLLALITNLLDATELISLYKCGSTPLNWRMREGGVKTFRYCPKPRLGISWPTTANYFRRLANFIVILPRNYEYLIVEGVDLLTIPKNVSQIRLVFENSDAFIAQLEHIILSDPDRFYYKERRWTHDEALFPNLTSLKIKKSFSPAGYDATYLHSRLQAPVLEEPRALIYLPFPGLKYLELPSDRLYDYPASIESLCLDFGELLSNFNKLPPSATELTRVSLLIRYAAQIHPFESDPPTGWLATSIRCAHSALSKIGLVAPPYPPYLSPLHGRSQKMVKEEIEMGHKYRNLVHNPTDEKSRELSRMIKFPPHLTSLYCWSDCYTTPYLMAMPHTLTSLFLQPSVSLDETSLDFLPHGLKHFKLVYKDVRRVKLLNSRLSEKSFYKLPPSLETLVLQSDHIPIRESAKLFGHLPKSLTRLNINTSKLVIIDPDLEHIPRSLIELEISPTQRLMGISSRCLDFLPPNLDILILPIALEGSELSHPTLKNVTQLLLNSIINLPSPPRLALPSRLWILNLSLDLNSLPAQDIFELSSLPESLTEVICTQPVRFDPTCARPLPPRLTRLHLLQTVEVSTAHITALPPSLTSLSLGGNIPYATQNGPNFYSLLPRSLTQLVFPTRWGAPPLHDEDLLHLPQDLIVLGSPHSLVTYEGLSLLPPLLRIFTVCENTPKFKDLMTLPPYCTLLFSYFD